MRVEIAIEKKAEGMFLTGMDYEVTLNLVFRVQLAVFNIEGMLLGSLLELPKIGSFV